TSRAGAGSTQRQIPRFVSILIPSLAWSNAKAANGGNLVAGGGVGGGRRSKGDGALASGVRKQDGVCRSTQRLASHRLGRGLVSGISPIRQTEVCGRESLNRLARIYE